MTLRAFVPLKGAFVPLSPKFDPLLSLLMPEQDLQGDHGSGPKPSELPMEEAF